MGFVTLLTVLGVVQGLSFLSSSETSSHIPSLNRPSSTGQLGLALESINSNVLTLSQISASQQKVSGNQLNSVLHTTKETAFSLLSAQISETFQKIEETRTEIEELEKSLLDAKKDCGKRSRCKDCTSSANCVWCEMEGKCVPGGVSGPLGGGCAIYSYKECVKLECAEAETCSACISLGCFWCENGGKCLPQEVLEDVCDNDLAAFNQNQCLIFRKNDPEPMEEYISPSIPMIPIDPGLAEKYRRILQLKNYENQLKADKTALENSMETLRDKKSDFDEMEPGDLVRINGLGAEIEKSVLEEREKRDVSVEGLKSQVRETSQLSPQKPRFIPPEPSPSFSH